MATSTWRRSAAFLIAGVLVLGACSSKDAATSKTGKDAASETTKLKGTPVANLKAVKSAVIQIVSKGTFAEPGETIGTHVEVESGGAGSGFIIDPSGIAVTNNHVVAGAASLEVFVGGDTEPLSAKVLGVSECNDLAVIDIEGDGFPFLEWYDGDIEPGLEVLAAGFPLGDPEYTLNKGIVSKAKADGDTPWASIGSTIEHDASIQPGNSGGPLVSADTGQVVGVNYAYGDPGTGVEQFFAISAKLAAPVVEKMQEGNDVLALGVNGQAVVDELGGAVGIFVSSVESGTPASKLGLQAGDIIERIEGLSVGSDGTMADYCDILGSNDASDEMSVQVLRFDEATRMRGSFNGDKLEPYEALDAATAETSEDVFSTLPFAEEYTEFTIVTDDTGTVEVSIPTVWIEVRTSTYALDDGTELPSITAAPNLQSFLDTYSTSGIDVTVSNPEIGVSVEDGMSEIYDYSSACLTPGPEEYDDGLYFGLIQFYSDCEGGTSMIVVIGAEPPGGEFTIFIVVQLATTADVAALSNIIDTFRVVV